ncbi:MAG: hypothetical protein KDD53_09435, partial [Bdellovibrionales bacterium]|nr:hypothetical protein [Bdellovibrionales bacterium]
MDNTQKGETLSVTWSISKKLVCLFTLWSVTAPQVSMAKDAPVREAASRPTVGWVEKVKVSPGGLIFHAKL